MKNKKQLLLITLLLGFLSLKSQSLDSLLIKAYLNNPEIKALQLEYEAALLKGPQVSELQDPTIGVGVPILRPETRLGSQVLMLSATQMFPWFGTLKAKKNVVIAMAKSKFERISVAKLNIDFKVKSAYYNLNLINEEQVVIAKNIRLLEALEKVTLAKVESGKILFSDVLTVQMKLDELRKQILILESQKIRFVAEINEVLNSSINTKYNIASIGLDIATINYDLTAYRSKIENNHPLINQLDWSIETANNELALNTKSGLPSFGLGIDYSLINNRIDADPMYNGRDVLIPKLILSVPIYRQKYKAKKQEENLKIEAYGLQKEQLTNLLLKNIQSLRSEYEDASIKNDLAKTQIKKLNSVYEILLEDYSTKGQRFNELMQIQNEINKYELMLLKTATNTHLIKFKIEQLTNF